MDDRPLVNLVGLATRLSLPREWLREQALAGLIPCLRVGNQLRFNVAAVREALGPLAATTWLGGATECQAVV